MKLLIKTPARLHLGLIDMNGGLGRLYGSIGIAIDRPNVILEAELMPGIPGGPVVHTADVESERVEEYARRFEHWHALPGPVRLRTESVIPAHVGLGSGTQLALAIGTALARLSGTAVDPERLSRELGRGAHSGIGIAAFQHGGLVVDGGHAWGSPDARVPPVIFRHDWPSEWRLVVAVPHVAPGLNGETEERAFQTLPPAPPELAEKICRLLVMQMLPALMEADIVPFGRALTDIQQLVGDSFADVQGGRFANSISGALIAHWLGSGAAGAGQSSWGPTAYALAGDEAEAERLADAAGSFLRSWDGGEIFVARGHNKGASVTEQ